MSFQCYPWLLVPPNIRMISQIPLLHTVDPRWHTLNKLEGSLQRFSLKTFCKFVKMLKKVEKMNSLKMPKRAKKGRHISTDGKKRNLCDISDSMHWNSTNFVVQVVCVHCTLKTEIWVIFMPLTMLIRTCPGGGYPFTPRGSTPHVR